MSQFKSKRGGKNPSFTKDGFMIDPEDTSSVIIFTIVDEFGDIVGVNSKVYPDIPPRIFKDIDAAMEHVIGFTHGVGYVVNTYLTEEQKERIGSVLSLGCISSSVKLNVARELDRISEEGVGEDTGHFIFSSQHRGGDAQENRKKYRDDVKAAKQMIKASRIADDDDDSDDTSSEYTEDVEEQKKSIKELFDRTISLDDED